MAVSQEVIDRIVGNVRKRYPGWEGVNDPRFQEEEVRYKRIASNEAKRRLLTDQTEAKAVLREIKAIGESTNLLFARGRLGDLAPLHRATEGGYQDELVQAMESFLFEPDLETGIDRFLAEMSKHDSFSWPFLTYFAFLIHPEWCYFIKPSVVTWMFNLVGARYPTLRMPSSSAYDEIITEASEIKTALHSYGVKDWIDFQSVLWTAYAAEHEQGRRHWKIAPGEGAWQWEECRSGGFIGLGWEELGDLSGLSEGEVEARINEQLGAHPDWTRTGANQVRDLLRIQPDDRIIANEGKGKILGFGKVTGPYRFETGQRQGHRIDVDWYDTQPRVLPEPNHRWQKTLVPLTGAEFERLEKLPQADPPIVPDPVKPIPPKPLIHPAFPLPDVAARTHLPTQTLERWLRAIRRKGQAVLYGPPGTGKTYVAKALAEHLVGGTEGILETLQFHPSFGYEDFMEGLRPERSAEGALDYKVRRGRFVEFCDRAQLHAGTSVLILDEINRANLARVFGELLYLLEYRDQSIQLPSGRPFSIPKQVVILGTMNTADRSIALVDHALRRRFAFLRVPPQPETLRQFHAQAGTAETLVAGLIKLLDRINLAIGDPHYHLGVSFFLVPALAEHLEDIWELEIEPFLEEYFFDRPETLAGFRWQQVREGLI